MASVPVAATIATSRCEASHLDTLQRKVTTELVTTRPEFYNSVKRIANEIDQTDTVRDKPSDYKSVMFSAHNINNYDGVKAVCPAIPERASLDTIEQLLDVELTGWII